MGAFDDFRSRISWSPSPSRTSKSSPANVSRSFSSRLSKEKIDEILDNPVETDYTYRHSLSYKSDGSEEYEHPRLCRRPFQPSTYSSFSSTPVGSDAATARDIDISYQVAVDDRCHRIECFTILKKLIVSKRNWFFIVLLLILVLGVGHHLFNNKTNDCPPERFHEGDNRVVLQNKSTLQNSSDMLLEMLDARDINISDQVAVDDRCHRIERFMSILKKQFHELHCENRLIDNETLEDIDISLSPHISNETGLTTLNHIPTMSSQQVCYDHSARHFNIFLGKCWYNDAPCDKVVRRHVLVALRIHFNKLYLNPFHWHPKKLTFEWKFAL